MDLEGAGLSRPKYTPGKGDFVYTATIRKKKLISSIYGNIYYECVCVCVSIPPPPPQTFKSAFLKDCKFFGA